MTHKLLALYGLKWNPFTADVPVEALWAQPRLDHFRWRMEQQVRDGGFALISLRRGYSLFDGMNPE